MTSFKDLGLNTTLYAIGKELGFKEPTLCQIKIIPQLLKKQNIGCEAWTGSGKTHAFLFPIIQNLEANNYSIQAVIMVPTQELGLQISQWIKVISEKIPWLKHKVLLPNNLLNSSSNQQILIGTPAALAQARKQHSRAFNQVKWLIIDECDFILQPDFINDVNDFCRYLNKQIIIGLFSATFNKELINWAKKTILQFKFVRVHQKRSENPLIKHYLIKTSEQQRFITLERFLNSFQAYFCLIFVNYKKEIDHVITIMQKLNFSFAVLSSSLSLRERKKIFQKIQKNDYQYVICTDLASRGIDWQQVSDVISLRPPQRINFYFHRAGRTGRINFKGRSFLFYSYEESKIILKLKAAGVKFNNVKIKPTNLKL